MSTQTPLELKKTVNLPKTGFAQKANLGQTEPARLKRWAEMGLYELIRRVNTMRKDAGLHLSDRIALTLPARDADLLPHRDWIARETLADAVEVGTAEDPAIAAV